MRRCLMALLLIAGLMAGAGGVRSARADGDAPGLGIVRAAYNDLLGLSYVHPDPVTMLTAGWASIPAALPKDTAPPPPLAPLPADPDAAFAAFATAYNSYIATYQLYQLRDHVPDRVALGIAGGMAGAAGERHTRLIIGDLTDLTGGAQFGLGIQATTHPPVIVTALAPGYSPAQVAGVRPGDEVIAVDSHLVQSSLDLAPPLSTVQGGQMTLTVRRGGQQLQITITPGDFSFPLLSSKMLPGGAGYLRLNDFGVNNAYFDNLTPFTTELDQQLDGFDAHGAKAMILDLRDNGGADTAAAAALLGRFLPDGTLTLREFDGAGRQALGAVSGAMHARQLPMVVLINGGTSAAAEEAAAVLHENNRAVLLGSKTAGSLAATRVVPISQTAALQIGLAQVATATGNVRIDGNGVAADIDAPDTRTTDDVRAGRDTQVDAAVKAVAQAPAPPAAQASGTPATITAVHQLLAGYVPAMTGLTLSDRAMASLEPLDAADLISPSELATGDVTDPAAMVTTLRARGWLGRHAQTFNVLIDEMQPELVVTVDAYATPDGAAAALHDNAFAAVQQPSPPPAAAGDGVVSYAGQWLRDGWTSMAWQRGNVIVTVTYAVPPGSGQRAADILTQTQQKIELSFQRYPVTSDTFQRNLQALAAPPPDANQAAAGVLAAPPVQPATARAPAALPPAAAPAGQAASSPSASASAGHGGGILNSTVLIAALCVVGLALLGGYALKRG